MDNKQDDPKQYGEIERPGKIEKPKFVPITDTLVFLKYPQIVIDTYPSLALKDMHLAELHRIGSKDLQEVTDKRMVINPFQSRLDRKGRLWVDVVFKKGDGVKLSAIRKIMKIHGKPGKGQYISGRIQSDRLPELMGMTVKLQTARPLYPALYASVPLMKASQNILTSNLPFAPTGETVIVGVVDVEGCDFKHPSFLKNGKTRLLALWDQNETGKNRGSKPKTYGYGVEFTRDQIDNALATPDPYASLKYTPLDKAHGTHVMDIAAGNLPTNSGVAPEADLIFVHIGKPVNPNDEELKTMGSSKYLLDAVQYIFDKAEEEGKKIGLERIPAVVNISLAGNGGSHDGTSPLEAAFDEMLNIPGRAVVIAAGNTFGESLHTMGTLTSAQPTYDLKWFIEDNQKSVWDLRQELEIWYSANEKLKVEVIDPDGESEGQCLLGETHGSFAAGNPVPLILIRHLKPDADPGEDENHINILIDNDHPGIRLGTWTIKLSLDDSLPGADRNVEFFAWIEYSGKSHSHFMGETITASTLNTIGNGTMPIVVGSYDPRPLVFEISEFSGAGPSRNRKNDKKPDLCAPGEFILAARATTDGVTLKAGTSMAAPHITGLIALMFEAAQTRANNPKILKMKEIADILTNTTDPQPAPGQKRQYDSQRGYGQVNALEALKKTINP